MELSQSPAPADVRSVPAVAKRPKLYKPLILWLGEIRWLTPLRMFLAIAVSAGLVSWTLGTPLATAINTAYGVAIVNYLVRRQQRLLLRMRQSISLNDAHFNYEHYALLRFRRSIIIGVSLFAPLALVLVNWNSVALRSIFSGNPFPPAYLWSFSLALIDWILIMQVLVIIVCNALRFYRLGRHHTRIDLLDTSVLAPYALAGIAVLVLFAGSYTIIPIAALDNRALLESALRSLLVSLPMAIFGIVLPILGIHRNLGEAKATEIRHVTRAIHGDRSALAQTRLAEESQFVPISNLVIYRQTVVEISEWPLNSVAAVRMVFITGVPIVAWVGGALGERFINALMG